MASSSTAVANRFLLAGSLVLAIGASAAGGYQLGVLGERVRGLAIAARTSGPTAPQYAAAPALPQPPQLPPAPTTTAPSAVVPAPPQPSSSGLNLDADGAPARIAEVLTDPDAAAQLLDVLGQARAVTTTGSRIGDHPVYAVIDPTCPHCQAAVEELAGDIPVSWIPVAVLGDTDAGMGVIHALFEAAEGSPDAAIASIHGDGLSPMMPDAATTEAVQRNTGLLMSLYEGSERAVAVPTLFVPKPDGTAQVVRGFDRSDADRIKTLYRES